MAIGKNKRKPSKSSLKSKKVTDTFLRKEWFNVRAPSMFAGATSGASPGMIGRTFVNKSTGKKMASDALLGRVFSISLADLNKEHSEDQGSRVIKLIVDHVENDTCLTNFYGMRLTTDRLKSLVRKWQSLIEAVVEVKTTDGCVVRLFALAFTKRREGQIKKTSYAQTSQIKNIRSKMREVILREASGCDLKQLFEKLCSEVIGKTIERETSGIYPLQNTYIRNAKLISRPKVDLARLATIHADPTKIVQSAPTEDIGTPMTQVKVTE